MTVYRVPEDRRLDFCPVCMFEIYLDPDEPHLLRCLLKYAIEARVGDDPRWRRWRRVI